MLGDELSTYIKRADFPPDFKLYIPFCRTLIRLLFSRTKLISARMSGVPVINKVIEFQRNDKDLIKIINTFTEDGQPTEKLRGTKEYLSLQ